MTEQEIAELRATAERYQQALEEWKGVAAAWMLDGYAHGLGIPADLMRWADGMLNNDSPRSSSRTRAALASSLPAPLPADTETETA